MSVMSQLADDFAEQKLMVTDTSGHDVEMLRDLWRSSALEVLAFAIPRLGAFPAGQEDSGAEIPERKNLGSV